ncbi:DDE-type integrase/transposase/recombinase [Aliihoeflea aestuarii]|uniref:DDE-type integrase/transposase/recombinase n=1 Tax=Aliihoeflea aestuarii TaxID=453840 RepID=UPI0020957FDA|nr:DDE-type integrase/transposase/recombinase [Aliihoeflea aestuarii]MCO6392396.1 DDE-type integrase/transposase/recombinase [Aliihoeflea aestuarii]
MDGFWLKKEKPSLAALLRRIREVCLTEGLSPPHRSTVQRRVSELIPMSAARKRGEREIEAASTPSPGQFNAAKPNALWQIDHTIVDVIVVDEQFRKPIGRPVLTIAIDVCTRMVAGFHLSLEAPSSTSVGLCLLHAVYDKTAWLDEREIDIPWPVAGLPEVLHCDNGADFRSRALSDACKEYGMRLQFRPPATPRFGGHIERLIGTMMGAVHLLPGTTFSNVKIRGGYDSEGRARLTLRELEKWIARPERPPARSPNPLPSSSWTSPTSRISRQSMNQTEFLGGTLKPIPESIRPHGLRRGVQWRPSMQWSS